MSEMTEVAPPAAPGNNATVILFDSTRFYTNGIARANMSRVIVTFSSVNQDSAVAGLIPYSSVNGGTNWDQAEAGVQITAASTSGTVNTHDYAVDRYKDFKLEYTAGATGPTVWRVSIKVVHGQRASVI